jgi:hypothetical protein
MSYSGARTGLVWCALIVAFPIGCSRKQKPINVEATQANLPDRRPDSDSSDSDRSTSALDDSSYDSPYADDTDTNGALGSRGTGALGSDPSTGSDPSGADLSGSGLGSGGLGSGIPGQGLGGLSGQDPDAGLGTLSGQGRDLDQRNGTNDPGTLGRGIGGLGVDDQASGTNAGDFPPGGIDRPGDRSGISGAGSNQNGVPGLTGLLGTSSSSPSPSPSNSPDPDELDPAEWARITGKPADQFAIAHGYINGAQNERPWSGKYDDILAADAWMISPTPVTPATTPGINVVFPNLSRNIFSATGR